MSETTAVRHQIAKNARALLRFLSEQKESISPLLIMTHDYPDPDALASAYALSYIAEKAYGIQTKVCYGGIIGRMENRAMVKSLRIPVHRLRNSDFKKYRNVAIVDTQPCFENNSFPKNRKAAIVIDQHGFDKKPVADLAIVNTECGATSVILAEALLLLKSDVPVRLATALAYGILSDTLNLYRAKHAEIIEIYQAILAKSDLKALAKIQNPSRSRRFFATLSKGVQNAKILRGLIVSHLGRVENPDLVSQMADFLLNYEKIAWAICTGRFKGKLYVSLRSEKPAAQAGEILRDIFENRGEAGGHGLIAGGSFYIGDTAADTVWEEAEKNLIDKLTKRLRIPSKLEFKHPFRQS